MEVASARDRNSVWESAKCCWKTVQGGRYLDVASVRDRNLVWESAKWWWTIGVDVPKASAGITSAGKDDLETVENLHLKLGESSLLSQN